MVSIEVPFWGSSRIINVWAETAAGERSRIKSRLNHRIALPTLEFRSLARFDERASKARLRNRFLLPCSRLIARSLHSGASSIASICPSPQADPTLREFARPYGLARSTGLSPPKPCSLASLFACPNERTRLHGVCSPFPSSRLLCLYLTWPAASASLRRPRGRVMLVRIDSLEELLLQHCHCGDDPRFPSRVQLVKRNL